MELIQQSEYEPYRVIVPRQNGTEILLVPAGDRFLLPWVELPRWRRVAENLTAAMRDRWGCELICLFTCDAILLPDHSNGTHYHVMECCYYTKKHNAQLEWVPISSLSQGSFTDPNDFPAVQLSFAEYDRCVQGTAPGPFAKPGWFEQLHLWVEDVIAPLGLRLNGSFCQFNASPTFSLIRFDTIGPSVWFKAVGEPNLREFPITLTIMRLFPEYVPLVLAAHPQWNGWLAEGICGYNLGETRDPEHWKAAAAALAKLQIASIGKRVQLLNSGARDLGVTRLSNVLEPFMDVMAQLMEEQVTASPVALGREEILEIREEIQNGLFLIGELGIGDTLGHLDLNPGNVVVSPETCKFLDWAEAYVGNPFFSFEYLRQHFRRVIGSGSKLEGELAAAYTEPWRGLFSAHDIDTALSVLPMLALFAYSAGSNAWCDEEKLRNLNSAGYMRSLTRQMKREADKIGKPESKCLR